MPTRRIIEFTLLSMMDVFPIRSYSPSREGKNSHAIHQKIVKCTYSQIAENEPDRNWRLRIK